MKKQLVCASVASLICALSVVPVVPAHAQSLQSNPVHNHKVVGMTGDIEIISQGGTATGGWVVYKGEGEVTVEIPSEKRPGPALTKVEAVGGGIWSYGSSIRMNGMKACSSEYQHMSSTHSSRAKMGSLQQADWGEPAGQVAYSYVTDWTLATCEAFWDNH